MARFFECDVCENKLDMDARVIELLVPGEWVTDEPDSDQLHADVCSWECLRAVIEQFDPQPEAEEKTFDEDPLEKALVAVRNRGPIQEGPRNSLPGVRIKTAGLQS